MKDDQTNKFCLCMYLFRQYQTYTHLLSYKKCQKKRKVNWLKYISFLLAVRVVKNYEIQCSKIGHFKNKFDFTVSPKSKTSFIFQTVLKNWNVRKFLEKIVFSMARYHYIFFHFIRFLCIHGLVQL